MKTRIGEPEGVGRIGRSALRPTVPRSVTAVSFQDGVIGAAYFAEIGHGRCYLRFGDGTRLSWYWETRGT